MRLLVNHTHHSLTGINSRVCGEDTTSIYIRLQVAKNPPVACKLATMCLDIKSTSAPLMLSLPPPQQSGNISMQALTLKSEAERRKPFENGHVTFMDIKHLVAAGFYFTDWGDVVCCAFCGVGVGYWKEGDITSKIDTNGRLDWSNVIDLLHTKWGF